MIQLKSYDNIAWLQNLCGEVVLRGFMLILLSFARFCSYPILWLLNSFFLRCLDHFIDVIYVEFTSKCSV
ncbi:hypothetical protein AMD27_09730 [Acinetobacter sp. TGL-Y2]|nr:hypothetical protein AMD27_09730 [Acinetobacter sp. TGL-Y2]